VSPTSYNPDWYDWFGPLPDNVVIGEGSYLYSSFAFRQCASERPCAVRLGKYANVYANTAFNLGPEGEVTVGDYSHLGDPTISTNGRVSIGSHCMVAWDTVLADVAYAVPPASRPLVDAHGGGLSDTDIVLADNVWIGAHAVLLGGARIGEGSVVGAGSVVDFEVPPYSVAAGSPARVMGPVKGAR
jgi:acetyltransferase-like isoleucine patch superfamily enzyme